MSTRTAALAVVAAASLVLAGCSAESEPETAAEGSPTGSVTSGLLAEHDLEGLSGKELVDTLDVSSDARPLELTASVREDDVLVSDGEQEVTLDLPAEEFRVSIAPYVDTTHECYFHNLGSCQGELVEEDVQVTITADDGEVLVDETVTTYTNGFVGYWLPRDITGTITVTQGELTGSVPFSTSEGDPTCITTLQMA